MTQKKQTIPFLTFRAGEGLGVPEAGMAIIRYNYDLGRIELSLDGGSYQGLSGSADGYFYGEFLVAPIVPPLLDGYIAYIDYASTELNKISVDSLLALLSSASSSLQAAYESGNTITTDSGNGEFSVSGTENISLSSFADIQISAIGTLFLGSGGVDAAWPAAVGSAGTVLTNDGAGNLSWDSPASGAPGGPDRAIQFSNAGVFDGSSALKWLTTGAVVVENLGVEGILSSQYARFVAGPLVPSIGGNEAALGLDLGDPALYLKLGATDDTALLQLQGSLGFSPGLSLRYTNNEYPIEKPLWIDNDGGPIKIGNNSAYYLTTGVTIGSVTTPVNISDAFTLPMIDGASGEVLTTDGAGNVSWAAAGGSGTVTGSGTATRVAFWDGASSLSSNANLYWDNTGSGKLGIGTNAPVAALDIASGQLAIPDGSAAAPAVAFRDNLNSGFFSPSNDIIGVGVNGTEIARFQQSGGSPVFLVGTSTVYGQFTFDSSDVTAGAVMLGHGAAGTVLQESYRGGQFAGVRSRGTKAAPTQIGAGDGMINVLGAGWTATGGINYGAMMTMKAEQAFTSTASGGRIEFHTTASGTDGFTTLGSSTTERVRITNAGSVGIGTTSPISLLSVGSSSQFQVNSSGDIVAIRGQTTTFPAANASGALTNDGSGNLSWSPAGTVTGSGVATRVAFWSGTSSLSSDSNLYWDDSNNRLGVGIATPAHVVDVQAGSTASGVYALNVDATLTPGGGTIVSYIEGSVSASVVAPVYGVIGYLSGAGTPSTSYAGSFGTVIAGSGQDPVSALQANFALQGSAAGTTASGHNIGMMGLASNGARNYAVFGNTTGDGTGANIAVTGMAKNNSGIRIGGLFALQTTGASQPTVNASAALIADNMDKGDPIFLARDNGTTTFSVGNDGVVLSRNTSDGTTAFSVQNAAGSTIFDVDTTNARVGVGTNAPASALSVGASSQFQVSSSGDLTRINDIPYSFPSSQGSANSILTNNGSGTLSWTSGAAQNSTAPISTKTANYTLASSDGTILADASSGAITMTLPSAASAVERIFTIKKKDITANIVTVDADASELIDGATTYTLSTQYEAIKIQSDGSAWWII
jgi:hypothetical protein